MLLGILYGAVIGDALGTATEFLSKDECHFHYDAETFTYADIIRDEHRAHWTRGDWTSNSDQMVGFYVLCEVLMFGVYRFGFLS